MKIKIENENPHSLKMKVVRDFENESSLRSFLGTKIFIVPENENEN